jgi:hypothetical protein
MNIQAQHGSLVQRVNGHFEQTKEKLDTKLIDGSAEYKNRYRELQLVTTMLLYSMEEYMEEEWEEEDLRSFIDHQFEDLESQIENDQVKQLRHHQMAAKLQLACLGIAIS